MTFILIYNPTWEVEASGMPVLDCRIWPETRPIPKPWRELEVAINVGPRTSFVVDDGVMTASEIKRRCAPGAINQINHCPTCGAFPFYPLRPEKEANRQPIQTEAARHPEHGPSPRAESRVCWRCGHLDVEHHDTGCWVVGCEQGCTGFTSQDPQPIGDKAAEPSAVSSNANHSSEESSAGTSPLTTE